MDARNEPATKGDVDDLRMAVKSDVDDLRIAVKSDVDDLRIAVKGDVDDLRIAVKGDVDDLRTTLEQLRGEVNHGYLDLIERITDSETRLLKAFYDFAQSNQKRLTELELNDASMKSRLATIEDRLLQVEKRLNMPPAA